MGTAKLEHAIEQLFVQNNDDASTAAMGYDCLFVVGEKRIRIGCHRAVIQARSTLLNGTANKNEPILEINLPDDDAEAISAIIQYCYTNTISTHQISTLESAGNLLLATKKFGLDRDPLFALCKNVLAFLEKQSLPARLEKKILAAPKSNLDLTCLIDDKTSSDLIIKTESEDILAHKCILLSRAPSLSSKIQLNADGTKSVVDISSRCRASVYRVLLFLYGDKVAAATQELVLQDVVTAKELHANGLVSKLERIVYISDDNALDMLKFALRNGLESLKNDALDGLANGDYDGLFESIKRLEESCSTISSEFEAVVRASEQTRTKQSPQLTQGISLRGCVGLVATSLVPVFLFQMQTDNEILVPLTNVCFCFTVGFFFL